jgi:hypothetical protein
MGSKSSTLRPQTAAAAVLIVTVLLAALVLRMSNGGVLSAHYNVTTREGRAEYLAAQGWTVDPETETAQEITLPREIDGVLADYNDLQRRQGFDLRPYCGLGCTVYSYVVTNYDADEPVLCTIYLYKNRIIAGDIHSTAMDGFMHGIRQS